MEINKGTKCPNCGHIIEDVMEVEMKPKHIILAAIIGLGIGLSLASVGSSWWGAAGTALLSGGIAFLISAKLRTYGKRVNVVDEAYDGNYDYNSPSSSHPNYECGDDTCWCHHSPLLDQVEQDRET